MRFGLNAKKIENQITKNIITSNNDILVKNLIKDYEKKIHVYCLFIKKYKNFFRIWKKKIVKIRRDLKIY